MSVTFHLYKVRDDIDYIKSPYENREARTIDNYDTYYEHSFSDGDSHGILDISYFKSASRKHHKLARSAKRLIKPIKNLNYKLCSTKRGYAYKYVTVDEILYRQGWFLKKKFFEKDMTVVFCNSKEQMQRFFNKYIDRNTARGRECEKAFIDAFEPGMIFECAF